MKPKLTNIITFFLLIKVLEVFTNGKVTSIGSQIIVFHNVHQVGTAVNERVFTRSHSFYDR
jgi:hypothetical protein